MKKLQKKIFIQGKIEALTGLHIGGSNEQMGIGGTDNLVIRNPITQLPIIPGSSLKGKMRALLELSKGLYDTVDLGKVGNDKKITKLFGMSADKNNSETHGSRLIVRDAEMIVDENDERWKNTDMLYTEAKTEVVINRINSAATPRTFERVPAGAEFSFEMIINVVCEDKQINETQNALCNLLAEGMQLLQDDYLGGNGSRGYGKIKFKDLEIKAKEYKDTVQEVKNPKEITELFKNFDLKANT